LGPVTLPSDGTYTLDIDPGGGTGVLAFHLTTPDAGSGAAAPSAAHAGVQAGKPLMPPQCSSSPAVRLLRLLYAHHRTRRPGYYHGRDALCLAPHAHGG